jgi:hypothetical protein
MSQTIDYIKPWAFSHSWALWMGLRTRRGLYTVTILSFCTPTRRGTVPRSTGRSSEQWVLLERNFTPSVVLVDDVDDVYSGSLGTVWYLTNIKHFPCWYQHELKFPRVLVQLYINTGKCFIFFCNIAQRNIKKDIFRVDIELYQHGSSPISVQNLQMLYDIIAYPTINQLH